MFPLRVYSNSAQLSIGSTTQLSKDIGPVITEEAREGIEKHIAEMEAAGHKVTRLKLPPEAEHGSFVAPAIIELESTTELTREVFGPVLALIKVKDFEEGLEVANNTEYGLTGSVFTDNEQHKQEAMARFHVGNFYINRKCTGALVGAHPFGGFNMSGTVSKAGGPDYMLQFLQAKTISEKLS